VTPDEYGDILYKANWAFNRYMGRNIWYVEYKPRNDILEFTVYYKRKGRNRRADVEIFAGKPHTLEEITEMVGQAYDEANVWTDEVFEGRQ
jgi:hypothetical protein